MRRFQHLSRSPTSYLQRRFGSSLVLNLSEDLGAMQTKSALPKTLPKSFTVGDMISDSPSARFLKVFGAADVPENFGSEPERSSRSHEVKKRIYQMIKARDYDSLLELFLHMTANSLDSLKKEEVISLSELSYYIRQMIEYQVGLINEAANSKLTSRHSTFSKRKFSEANYFRVRIRKLYENLLYGNSRESMYERTKRADLYNSNNLTGFQLSIADYENLIYLELRNHKLDLASKWFLRLEKQFENHQELMTRSMWIMKLQTYCGGLPSTWKSNSRDQSAQSHNPLKSKFKASVPFGQILNGFFEAQNSLSGDKMSIDTQLGETLIYCIGHSTQLDVLEKFIERVWGVSFTEKKAATSHLPSVNDPSYPNINILKAIVIAYSYNGEFFKAMRYINAFQELYDINLASPKSKNFWEHVFQMCNRSTSFNEDTALHYFLSKTSSRHISEKTSLVEIQKNADFDYEGYLTYIDDLKAQRVTTCSELWSLFLRENGFYSSRITRIYLNFLKEELEPLESIESKYYDLMHYLDRQYTLYHVSDGSFNRSSTNAIKYTSISVTNLYESALRDFVNHKLKATLRGQCQPLIVEWSLNEPMKARLTEWLRDEVLPEYSEMLEKKREEVMISMRTEEKDSFLGIM